MLSYAFITVDQESLTKIDALRHFLSDEKADHQYVISPEKYQDNYKCKVDNADEDFIRLFDKFCRTINDSIRLAFSLTGESHLQMTYLPKVKKFEFINF